MLVSTVRCLGVAVFGYGKGAGRFREEKARTIFTGDVMNILIAQLIRSCHGYAYETAGIISGFFDDPGEARTCARHIEDRFHAPVVICGCELTVLGK